MTTPAQCVATFLSPTEVKVVGPDSLHEWREAQRFKVPGAEFTPRFKRHLWDGTHAPGRWCRRIPGDLWELRASRGILRRLAADLPVVLSAGHADAPIPPAETAKWLRTHTILPTLRDYQQTAVRAALTEQWGRVALATNAGKGAVIALLAEFCFSHRQRVLILCDEIAVFDALLGELTQWASAQPSIVGQGVTDPPKEALALAMVPTLARRISKGEAAPAWIAWLQAQTMVLLDEADKATARTWRDILGYCGASHWRVGFSGTFPSPTDDPYADLRMDELMGPVLVQQGNIDMIRRGVSARPDVVLHRYDVTNTLSPLPHDWYGASGPARRRWVFEQAIVNNFARHDYIASLIRPDTPTAVIINRIDHGEALAATIPGSVFLDGSAEPAYRTATLERFQRGEVRVLVVSKILDRGTNRLGTAADLIFASGEGSTRQTLQRIGRGLRRAGGKEFLRLVDIVDSADFGASPSKTEKRIATYLHSAARKRVGLYHREQFEIEVAAA